MSGLSYLNRTGVESAALSAPVSTMTFQVDPTDRSKSLREDCPRGRPMPVVLGLQNGDRQKKFHKKNPAVASRALKTRDAP
jgi:hypothetical protein